MNETNQQWARMRFRKNKVWVALDSAGDPLVTNGKLLIKYQLDQKHEYRVLPKHVHPLNKSEMAAKGTSDKAASERSRPVFKEAQKRDNKNGVIHVYTDGASSGNPGPAGIGVLLRYGDHEKEVSKYIGQATNNIAELEAIRAGLSLIRNHSLPVRVYTDSAYALGLLSKGWKAQKNRKLIADIRKLVSAFKDIVFVKVKGHAGHEDNERADELATSAIKREIRK